MRVAIVTTVKNEENSLGEFLDSLSKQSVSADEVIIVDGGSRDKTMDILQKYADKHGEVKIVALPGSKPSVALNHAIRLSNSDVIAITTAGCILDRRWLENISRPLREQCADVVAGWYQADPRTPFEEIVGEVTLPKLESINPSSFLPSFRSMALRREAWERVGGIPEHLTFAGDDTLFAIRLREAGLRITFVPNAVVYWRPRSSLRGVWKQYFAYALGDGEAGLFTKRYLRILLQLHVPTLALLVAGYRNPLFWALLALGGLLYCAYLCRRYPHLGVRVCPILFTVHAASGFGWVKGLLNRLVRRGRVPR